MAAVNFDLGSSLFPSGSQSAATYVSLDQTNAFHRGLKLVINITAIATGTLTVTIQGKEPLSGQYYTLLASAALNATGTTVLTIYPSVAATANVAVSDVLPYTWRVSAVQSAGTVTATIGASLIV